MFECPPSSLENEEIGLILGLDLLFQSRSSSGQELEFKNSIALPCSAALLWFAQLLDPCSGLFNFLTPAGFWPGLHNFLII